VGIQFANETTEYRKARDTLLDEEIALRRQMEALAKSRRELPPGPAIEEDYVFDGLGADGKPAKIKLSELFRKGTNTLFIYHFMFPRHKSDSRPGAAHGKTAELPTEDQPCPSCTGLLDQLDGAAPHYEAGGGNFAVVGKTSLDRLLDVARDRHWRHLRLLSAANTTFKRDYHGEDERGQQQPVITVFKKDADGTIRLFWASEMMFAPSDPGQDPRASGTIEPLWNLFDMGPNGRPDFDEQMNYDCCHGAKPREASGS
jgi:predicted dithiol-disulfide oxidoreductase (DUF899 family)